MTCDILYNQRESGAQLSSRLCLCNWKESIIMHSTNPPSRSFPNVAFETVLMFVSMQFQCIQHDDIPFSPFQRKSSSISSFYAPLPQSIDAVISLALCPKVMSQAPQHFNFRYTSHLSRLLSSPCRLSARSFPFTRELGEMEPIMKWNGRNLNTD